MKNVLIWCAFIALASPPVLVGSAIFGMFFVDRKMSEIEDAAPLSLEEVRRRTWMYRESQEKLSNWSDNRKYTFGVPTDVDVSAYRYNIFWNSFVIFFDKDDNLLRLIPLENPA